MANPRDLLSPSDSESSLLVEQSMRISEEKSSNPNQVLQVNEQGIMSVITARKKVADGIQLVYTPISDKQKYLSSKQQAKYEDYTFEQMLSLALEQINKDDGQPEKYLVYIYHHAFPNKEERTVQAEALKLLAKHMLNKRFTRSKLEDTKQRQLKVALACYREIAHLGTTLPIDNEDLPDVPANRPDKQSEQLALNQSIWEAQKIFGLLSDADIAVIAKSPQPSLLLHICYFYYKNIQLEISDKLSASDAKEQFTPSLDEGLSQSLITEVTEVIKKKPKLTLESKDAHNPLFILIANEFSPPNFEIEGNENIQPAEALARAFCYTTAAKYQEQQNNFELQSQWLTIASARLRYSVKSSSSSNSPKAFPKHHPLVESEITKLQLAQAIITLNNAQINLQTILDPNKNYAEALNQLAECIRLTLAASTAANAAKGLLSQKQEKQLTVTKEIINKIFPELLKKKPSIPSQDEIVATTKLKDSIGNHAVITPADSFFSTLVQIQLLTEPANYPTFIKQKACAFFHKDMKPLSPEAYRAVRLMIAEDMRKGEHGFTQDSTLADLYENLGNEPTHAHHYQALADYLKNKATPADWATAQMLYEWVATKETRAERLEIKSDNSHYFDEADEFLPIWNELADMHVKSSQDTNTGLNVQSKVESLIYYPILMALYGDEYTKAKGFTYLENLIAFYQTNYPVYNFLKMAILTWKNLPSTRLGNSEISPDLNLINLLLKSILGSALYQQLEPHFNVFMEYRKKELEAAEKALIQPLHDTIKAYEKDFEVQEAALAEWLKNEKEWEEYEKNAEKDKQTLKQEVAQANTHLLELTNANKILAEEASQQASHVAILQQESNQLTQTLAEVKQAYCAANAKIEEQLKDNKRLNEQATEQTLQFEQLQHEFALLSQQLEKMKQNQVAEEKSFLSASMPLPQPSLIVATPEPHQLTSAPEQFEPESKKHESSSKISLQRALSILSFLRISSSNVRVSSIDNLLTDPTASAAADNDPQKFVMSQVMPAIEEVIGEIFEEIKKIELKIQVNTATHEDQKAKDNLQLKLKFFLGVQAAIASEDDAIHSAAFRAQATTKLLKLGHTKFPMFSSNPVHHSSASSQQRMFAPPASRASSNSASSSMAPSSTTTRTLPQSASNNHTNRSSSNLTSRSTRP